MLGHLSIRQYSLTSVSSKNLFGADNQQETDSFFVFQGTMKDPQRLYARQLNEFHPVEDIVRAAWRHAETDRNDQSSDAKQWLLKAASRKQYS